MTDEAAVRLVLDQLAKKRGCKDWEHFLWKKQDAMSDICFDTKEELEKLLFDCFVAGQKQEQKELEILLDKRLEILDKQFPDTRPYKNEARAQLAHMRDAALWEIENIKKRLFSEGGEKKV